MAAPTPAPREGNSATQIAILLAVSGVLLYGAFFVLSGLYADSKNSGRDLAKMITPEALASIRKAFAIFVGAVTLTGIAAAFQTRLVAHGLAVVAGLASLIAAYFAFQKDMPMVLPVTLVVVGLLYPFLTVLSMVQKSRAAWSFLVALCYTLGVVLLFGAPKVRAQIDVSLWTAMVIPGLLVVAGVALTALRRDYRGAA